MIHLTLTPAEHAFLLLKLGRGTGSTIRPGESLSAEEVLRLTEKVEGAARTTSWLIFSEIMTAPGESPEKSEQNARGHVEMLRDAADDLEKEIERGMVAQWHAHATT